jgi:hypothetical protein
LLSLFPFGSPSLSPDYQKFLALTALGVIYGAKDIIVAAMKTRLRLVCFFVSIFHFGPAWGATANREESIRQARVWSHPSWISSEFAFDSSFDISMSPTGDPRDVVFSQEELRCEVTAKSLSHSLGGKTRKFYCELQPDAISKTDLVKFKYKHIDGEVPGEILGTRLLWALGFASDRIFPVERLNCFGCSEDPFFDRRKDDSPEAHPRLFERVSAERQYPGEEIKLPLEGWRFNELMELLPADVGAREDAIEKRDALRLLAVFMRHADNKGPNQSLVCNGKVSPEGGCTGETTLYIQDIGTSFGYGTSEKRIPSKVNLREWKNVPIWRDAARCVAELGPNDCREMETPEISRRGHALLARLLHGFVGGSEGRLRVRRLFQMAHAEDRGGSLDEWTDVFVSKVRELEQGCTP